MKSRIMRKLFFGDLLIVLLLLLFQLCFQAFLFEPFLVSEQSKRLTRSMDALQSAIVKGDADLAHLRINEEMERGIVLVVENQQHQQIFGQPIYSYQQCFTLEDHNGKCYTIVEDYLDSIPLQAIEPGDELSIEGYLLDADQSLVMPSKVYRSEDGAVLGVDTFLMIDRLKNVEEPQTIMEASTNDSEVINPPAGIMISTDSSSAGMGNQPNSDGETKVGKGVLISDSLNRISPTTTPPAEVSADLITPAPKDDSALPVGITVHVPDDENAPLNSFRMYSPFDVTDQMNAESQDGLEVSEEQNSALRIARILIVDSGNRVGDSFPVSITGRVVDISGSGDQDLVIQQGLINDERQRISAVSALTGSTETYTRSAQMTTGRYFLRVVRMAEPKMTLIGTISLYSIKDMNIMLNTFHIILFCVELALLVVALYFFSRIFTKPLVDMNKVALKIAHQDFGSKVDIITRDEIGVLGQSINTISTNLEHRISEINAINDRLHLDYEREVALQNRHRELSATFSHELKAPLTIIRGCIDNIQNTGDPVELVEQQTMALHELDRAGNLITQMLEIARMESPYFTLCKREIDLWMIFFKVYDELRLPIQQRGMRVEYVAGDEVLVDADAELLERVIDNAMTNAMKYSPRGSAITVEITSARNRHTFAITNSNSSISPKELEKIWKPFYRVRTPGTDTANGSGLGLMIISGILDAHGFSYAIRNTANGVEFSFTCPVAGPASDLQEEA